MSLSISNARIEELCASANDDQHSLAKAGNLAPWYPSYGSGGITYSPPILVTAGTREHLLSLRRKIEQAGVPLISGNELESELRENRR